MKTNQWRLALVIGGTTLGVYLAFRYILPIVVPFLFAYFLAKMLFPIIVFCHSRFRVPRMLSSGVIVFTLTATIGCGVFCLGRVLLAQLRGLIQNIPVYQKMIAGKLNRMCEHCNRFFGWEDGTLLKLMEENMEQIRLNLKTKVMPSMTQHTLQGVIKLLGIGAVFFLVFVSVLMIIKDMEELKEDYKKCCFYKQIHPITSYLSRVGFAYLKAQFIIISLVTIACTIALFLIHNEYPLVIGLGIGIFDAFPLLGSGSILVPWAIWKLFTGEMVEAAVLLTLYLCCQLTRQILEPKLIGDRIGIKPIFTIMAMYAGVKMFGIEGFFLGPIALIIIRSIIQTQC